MSGRDNDVRDQIEKRHKLELRACDEILDAYRARVSPWSGRPIHVDPSDERVAAEEIIALELSRSSKSYEASIALARLGFGEQAAMINRAMFEGMAVAHWVHANESEAVDRFVRAAKLHDHLHVERFRNAGWIDEDEAATLEPMDPAELQALKSDFGNYGEWMWTGHKNLRELLGQIEDQWETEQARKHLWTFYNIAHHDNTQLLHSTVSGTARALVRRERDGLRMWNGPSSSSIDKALFGAYWIFINMFSLAADRFDLGEREALDTMMKRQQYDFLEFTAADTADVGRNDPCPCGSGKKFKKCHEEQAKMS